MDDLRRLLKLSEKQLAFRLQNDPASRLRRPAVVRALALAAHDLRHDPVQTATAARAARQVAESLPTSSPQARGWALAVSGNAWRIRGELERARAALDVAAQEARSTDDGLLQRRILSYRASLATATGEYVAARRLLDRLCAVCESDGATRELTKSLLQAGRVENRAGNPFAAYRLLRRALEVLPWPTDRRLYLLIAFSQVRSCLDLGACSAGIDLVYKTRTLCLDDPLMYAYNRWLEGRARLALEDDDAAEVLACARQDLRRLGQRWNAGLASLELAQVRLRQGWLADAARLAAETLPLWNGAKLNRRAAATRELLAEAIARGAVNAGLLRRAVADFEHGGQGG